MKLYITNVMTKYNNSIYYLFGQLSIIYMSVRDQCSNQVYLDNNINTNDFKFAFNENY